MLADVEEEKEALQLQLTKQQPKVESYETFLDSKGCKKVGEVVKVLNISEKKFFCVAKYKNNKFSPIYTLCQNF